jgi:hypothetical protein
VAPPGPMAGGAVLVAPGTASSATPGKLAGKVGGLGTGATVV